MECDVASSGQEDTDMPAPIQKTRRATARVVALPAPDTTAWVRAAGLAMAAVVAGAVFSAGWSLAGLVLTAL